MVQEAVEKFFDKSPRKDVNPDEAVAVGAAIQGAVLSGDKNDVLLLDVTPLSLGIETMGGVFTKLIEKNTTIPTKKSQIFSTAEDNQPAVTIKVGQGERQIAEHNKMLGLFNLEGIPPSPRGIPQIEVTFDVDANGILSVSAKDKGTGKENKITIQANSGLSDSEIDQMIKDAEAHAEEDTKKMSLINSRNSAEGHSNSIRKELEKHSEKLKAEEKSKIEDALAAVSEAMKGDDTSAINQSIEALNEVSAPLFTAMNEANAQPSDAPKADDNVVDAEFTEVKKDNA
jgi:molecular chaperone DnaK